MSTNVVSKAVNWMKTQYDNAASTVTSIRDTASEQYRAALEKYNEIKSRIIGAYNAIGKWVQFLNTLKAAGEITQKMVTEAENLWNTEVRPALKRAFPKLFTGA